MKDDKVINIVEEFKNDALDMQNQLHKEVTGKIDKFIS